MKLYLVITLFLLVGSTTKITATNKCTCTQLETQTECVKMDGCIWNSKLMNCEVRLRTTTSSTTQTTSSENPCEKYNESSCTSSDGCAWEIKKCVPFTSCSVYTLVTNALCQQIQKKCITDGTKCVELGECSSYLTPISCVKNLKPDSENNFCFWDTSTGIGKCIDVVDCQQLPKYYKTDEECRKKIKYCTVSPYGGCIQSGVTCADQTLSMQCYYDQNMVTQCSWNGSTCANRSCDSAPIDRNTDALCKLYLPQCTTKLNGGCQERKACSDANLSAACVTNANGNECFWYENVCYEKKCENAPFAYTTLSECQSFMRGCVQKQGGGCNALGACSTITLSEGCLVDSANNKCFWDTTDRSCKQVICSNAPQTINTFAKCVEFKSDCTLAASGKGCVNRTCENAPTSADANIRTNYDCNQYLSGCITKQGGGCTTLSTCENITYELACEKDNQGRQCFWNSNMCKLKSCNNAPSTYNTHALCQSFDKKCTVNRQRQGCTDMECQVMDQQDICQSDKNGNRCYWVGLCYDKTCENATSDLNTDTKCRTYLSKCTVSHTGVGCMIRPAQCVEMTLESQCVNNYYGGICAWVNGRCYDKACFTAPLTSDYDTYEECQAYLPTCTVRSDGVGGCQDLSACNTYTAARSCRYNATGGVCEMNGSVCADKACNTSPATNNSNALCDTYRTGCIVNASGNGCIDKPAACSGMTTSNQCTATSTNSSGGPCAWVSGACVDRSCASAPATVDYDTHTECNTFLNTCTVVATGTGGCITLLASCPSYTSMRQCEKITGGTQCGWYNNGCTTRACFYAPDTNGYDSDSECSAYMSTCTVVRRVGGNGCTTRNSGCQNLSEHQCDYDSTNTQCVWDTTVTTPYCKTRTCTFTIGVTVFNTTNCNTWMSGCVSNNSANGCISKYSSCSSYTALDNCIETSGGTICYWDGTTCSNRSCSVTQSITEFDHTNCFAWLKTCTVNLPTTCGDKPATCSAALNYDQCYYTSGGTQCAWVSGACVDRTCTNHGYAVTSFTNTNCSNWMSACSANPGVTACEITRTCTNYGTNVTTFNHANCSGWLNTCTVNSGGNACIDKTCTNHDANVTTFSSSNCSGWLSTCKNNTDSTACVTSKTCTNHGSNVTVYNHINCNTWLNTCTVSGNACADKTCYNHGTFVTTFTHSNCNAWLSTCTVSNDGLSCEAKNCDNYGSNITTFDNTNCNAWSSVCNVNSTGTGCVTTRNCSSTALTSFNYQDCVDWYYSCTRQNSISCYNKTCTNYSSNISVFNHTNCQAWLYECSGTTSCYDKTCWNYGSNIVDFTHANCQAWLPQCTVNSTGDGCDVKTCTNYGTNLGGLTDANCKKWLPYCEINSGTTACQSSRTTCSSATLTQVVTWTYAHCEAYLYSCTRSGSSCIDKTCANASSSYIISYSHTNCTKWSPTCTINISESICIDRTCTNYGANLSAMTHAGCNAWLSSCTINAAGTDCEEKTCSNHGSNVTVFNAANCSGWLSSCQAGTGKCVTVRTCSNHSITSYNYANCSGWLDTCTNSGSSCVDKTCSNYGSNISYYNHESCTNYLSTCTINYSFNGCIDRTCDNYGENISTFTIASCQAWLSYCTVNSTNDGCVSSKTCTNHGSAVTTFNHVNCSGWLSTCTVNTGGTACETRSCTNYGANVTIFNHSNCNTWLNKCTVNSGSTACQDKNCTNHQSNITVFTAINCYNWESSCIVNSNGTACITTRTCTNYGSNVTTFDHANCNAWLSSCTVNGGGTACMDKTCASATAALVSTFNDANCAAWLSTCTANGGATACATKTCALAPGAIPKDDANCSSWMSTCTGDNTNCIDKTCANYSGSVNSTNCSNYLSTCTSYSPNTSCETIRTCAAKTAPFSVSDCKNWLNSCSSNSGDTACEDATCTNYGTYVSIFIYVNCSNWKSTCTNNATNTACEDKNCTNYQANISTFNHNNCSNWSSKCTNNSSSNACEQRNCTNSSGKISVISDQNCQAYWPACVMNSNKNACETSCTNYGSAITVFNHSNCNAWEPQCTVNSGGTACEKRSCTNYGSNVVSFTHSNCSTWLSTCTSSGSACVERTCFNYSSYIGSTFSHSICNTWFSQCTVNHDNTGCQMKTCTNHGGYVYTFTDTNCSNWLSYCVANYNATGCTSSRTCTNHGSNVTTFNHYNCSQWLSTCTVNSGNTACESTNCSNYSTNIPSINHVNCTNWNELCTYDGTSSCTYRTCTNHGSYITSFNDANCSDWLFYCEVNYRGNDCITRSCINHPGMSLNHSNCKYWLPYCTINSAGTECYTTRTCANAGIYITKYNHFTCEQWNSLCTVNTAGDGCEWKTCYNHKTQVTTFNDTNCNNWMFKCQANGDASGCEFKSCTNYGTRVQYPYSSNWCRYYLEECSTNGSTCILNTSYECSRTDYQQKLQQFNVATCSNWSSTCVPNSANSACIGRTCSNYTGILTTFNFITCSGWLPTCTNNGTTGCQDRTCTNYGSNVTTFSHTNCTGWLSSCTVNAAGNACETRTCSNHGSNVTTFTNSNCYNWLNSCTNNGTWGCVDKNCDNHTISTFNHNNCYSWLPICTVHPQGGSCVSVRNCSNYGSNVTTFNHANCQGWLYSCTVNTANNGCMDKTCDNYGSNVTTFTHINCQGWLPNCTVNSSNNKCEQRTCTNHGTYVTSFTTTNCQNWLSICKLAPTSTACEYKTCDNHSITTFNHTNCSAWLSYCTVSNDGKSCTTSRTCTNYGSEVTVFNHSNCINWLSTCTNNSTTACQDKTCTNHGSNISSVNHNNCQNWMFSCTVNGANCETKSCTNYGSNVVVYTHSNCNTWWSTCTVNSSSSGCTDKTCSNTYGISTFTHANCETWKSSCQLNKPTTCTSLQSNCGNGGVSYNQCYVDTNKDNCVWYNGNCTDRTCANYTGAVFSHVACETWLSTCTVDSLATHAGCVTKPTACTNAGVVQDQCVSDRYGGNCVWVSTSCQARSCSNYSTAPFTHANCETWLSSCTVDALATPAGCVTKQANCSGYSVQGQCEKTSGGTVCFWNGTSCENRTCELAAQSVAYDTDAECKAFLSTCTVARVGECMNRLTNCSSYLQESQCVKNFAGGTCFWNTVTSTCADITCSNAPTTKTSHSDCNSFLNTCTLAGTGSGCTNLNQCNNYTIQGQCVISNTNQTCAWSGGQCYVKSCSTAASDTTRDTHTECQSYLNTCTVAATGIGGCVPLAACNTYTSERQCVQNTSGQPCGWNGTLCNDKSCTTAPPTLDFSSDSACESYLTGCTVIPTGTGGCQIRAQACANYTTIRQCVKTITNQQCYWNGTTCVERTCKNAPDTARTAQLCEQHYSLCYSDLVYCRLEKCEDLPYKTDDACRSVSSKCTSNGTTCIDRKECTDAPNEIACQIDSSYRNCAWVVEPGRTYCTLKSCSTAPFYYTTEEDCNSYFSGCTTKKGGGCVSKSTCEAVQIRAACTTSSTNKRCVWAQDVCRPEICQDYVAKSDNECNILMNGCITDGVQCIPPQTCDKFTTKLACRTGTDGPCVWYSQGCSVFNDCSSIISKYDAICKSASKECTTDGTQCIGLKLCSEYVLKESCVTGTDGECTWIGTTSKCKRFLTCYDLPYLTHDQCYTANTKCTTDTKQGCIPLLSCSLYTYQEQCKVSSVGMLRISTNEITQTGLCAWKNDKCLDQSCEDLSGETHQLCSAQLKGCTSNGSKCLTQANCSTYTNPYTCMTAQGIEGPCQLVQNPVSCRSMECSDIVVNYSHQVCRQALSNCISDGKQCIAKDICINYPNQYACSQEGIDGICAWNGTTCKLMTSCEDATTDGDACTKYSQKCYWNSAASTKKCIPHTCETKYTTGVCNYVESFDSLSLIICQYSQGKCSEVDPNTLTENECLDNTNSFYRWNLQIKSCYSCSSSLNSSPNSSQIPDATVQYGQILYAWCLFIMIIL